MPRKELEEIDEAEELWNYLRGKASKIDFSNLSDGELNIVAAGLFREQQRRELGEQYEPPRPQGVPRVQGSGATGTHGSLEGGALQGGASGKTLAQQLEMMTKSSGVRRSISIGSQMTVYAGGAAALGAAALGAVQRQAERPKGLPQAPRKPGDRAERTSRMSGRTSQSTTATSTRWTGCLTRRCHRQTGRQGRTAGLQRGSWMMDMVPVTDVEWIIQNTDSIGAPRSQVLTQ